MTEPINKASVLAAFHTKFGHPARVFRAPARINLIGEHCDYNDGFVMPTNTALYTWLAIAPRNDRTVRILASDIGLIVEIKLDELIAGQERGWQEYPKGVLRVLQDEGFDLIGADILITGEIPLGGGLSSSASLETVIALAMLSISGHEIDPKRIALMCRAAENEFVGVACGIMDQYVISLCNKDQAMMLDCRSLEYKFVPLPADAQLLIVNSGVKHRLNEGDYNNRQQECEQVVSILVDNGLIITALRDVDMMQLEKHRDELGDVLYHRGRHVITEIQRVRDAYQAIINNETATLGQLMNQSHDSLKDDFEVSCEELDALVDISRGCVGVYGSRMVGAGFGGCTVSLVETGKIDSTVLEICKKYQKVLGREPWYHVLRASDPVQEVL